MDLDEKEQERNAELARVARDAAAELTKDLTVEDTTPEPPPKRKR